MSIRNIAFRVVIMGILLMVFAHVNAQGLQLYTTYPKISVSPGELVDYNVELINNSSGIRTSTITVQGLPKGWTYELKSGNYKIDELSVLGKDRKSLNLKIFVPGNEAKGTYRFGLLAGNTRLPLTIHVAENGVSNADFSSQQTNMQGSANTTFTYNATLFNASSEPQVYALSANAQAGWGVVFKSEGKEVSSVNIEANQRKDILIEITPPEGIKKGNYKIPVRATGGSHQSELTFEAVVTGSYKLDFSTPSGKLSAEATAGSTETIQLVVRNTGSSDINQLNFSADQPANWEVIFEPSRINTLKAGESATINAKVKPASNAVAGDYMVSFHAKSSEVSSTKELRLTVDTSILRGWLGILFIAVAIGAVYVLIRKYGRR